MQEELVLHPIGVVHSPITDRRLMPAGGVPAEIEIFPAYRDGLLHIEENTHIWVIGWFTASDRQRLQVVRPGYDPERRQRGVFGLRSVARPNPLALTATRLITVHDGVLHVDPLDLIDGTPVVDLKRYSPSIDCIFAARSSRDRFSFDVMTPEWLSEFEAEAANFHGERCPAVVVAARLVQYVATCWQVRPKDERLQLVVGNQPALGHLVDALQALTGATFGSGRLIVDPEQQIAFRYDARMLKAVPRPLPTADLALLRRCPLETLVMLDDNAALLPTEGAHGTDQRDSAPQQ
ncbi:tRNA (N6-threonylcarbamoyladenosine(37)-N6)-methyltransferase TrmO [Thermorudis peleae]|uniref:tRNA (N6-threonylcarbamoyladenosine(37)-N6)-methyltransferase TrmO n=1 Tax=Thermorudis peleae TaxID=1382356 RepID=UPI000690A79D|nr:tRNA (N6-threonylcarbamoyladenosine(37)-N6)-methyltransferase TrmO [Thermorudis peleae]MBX6754303.1 tRNA (N6-threonylcarbamoyladenosine(37)-N6)-methyltransferase TrmO [Thermorudis peleae]